MVDKFPPLSSLRLPTAKIEKMAEDLKLGIERERRFGKSPDPLKALKALADLWRGQGEGP